ncbi:hypothetical protein LZL87_013387 [Fusarium oxysporum]|nr:hypothetical protein LZL87_013387 [Fusarium oxysporum]
MNCTYGSSSARVKPLDYIRHLESRVADLEAQLACSTPRNNEHAAASVGFSDANPQAGSSQALPDAIDTLFGPGDDLLSSFDGSETYHGAFASLNVLRIVRDKCDSLANIMAPLSSDRILAEAFTKDTAPSASEQTMPLAADLPDLTECQRLCYIAIEEALPCHECIDRETFFAQLVRVHAKPWEELVPSDRAFLALVFSVLYAIDTYLASTLGVPKLFHQVDTFQILPLRDENLNDHGISFVRQNPHTPEAETLVSCRILVIMAEIHTRRSPFGKGMALNSDSRTYRLTSQDVAYLDAQLTEWYNSLPPVDEIPPVKRALHAQLAIRHTYAITQMALHRPFLHHLTRKADDHSFCMEGYAYGSQCITAAMQTVW